jgi:hypothetical protein
MPRYIVQRTFADGLDVPMTDSQAELCQATVPTDPKATASMNASLVRVVPARRHAPLATMPGPSRRITVEPLTVPLTLPSIPAPAPPEIEPTTEPWPVGDPVPTP